ncbi:hypothetical protein NP233_g9170 [Leucocoprinus birnbaumii]|uniref:Uncharacterized protein n=1 Tax=Leucocoprinus birnbaumii TaxID=56174 RepID=A0AAD5VL24_9AGAR|nr:hypothetical protein NP233_g9170 [Leucocoprinus birnbaumii]
MRTDNLFDDLGAGLGGEGLDLKLGEFGDKQEGQDATKPAEGDLVDLGAADDGGGGSKTPKKGDGSGSSGGENKGSEENASGGDGGNAGNAGADSEPAAGGEVQIDPQNNPLSPVPSAFSSVAGVPSEIKERNKQAIIIRAQIHELTKRIEDLKEEKLRAQGKEELDPLSEESTLKEAEIQKAERSLEKLKKRAEKRHQAAVESTNQLTVPKTLTVNLESYTADNAATRLEDLLGLMFGPERKSFKMEIVLPKGGPGKAVKAAVQKVLTDYGIKGISKVSGLNVTVMSKTYADMITAFRQKHTKEDS